MILLEQCDVSELSAGGAGGLGLGHPLADISLSEHAHVRLDLVAEFSVCSAIPEQSPKFRRQGAQIVGHLYSWPSSLNRRPITPAIRSQFSVSRASCFRPLFVIESYFALRLFSDVPHSEAIHFRCWSHRSEM